MTLTDPALIQTVDTTQRSLSSAPVAEDIAQTHGPLCAALQALPLPCVVTDPRRDDNPMVFVNDAFCRLTGYGREELVGRNCRLLQGEATDRKAVIELRDAIQSREPIGTDVINHRRDGTAFVNSLVVVPVYDDSGVALYLGIQSSPNMPLTLASLAGA